MRRRQEMQRRGFVMLVSILVIAALGMTVAVSLLLLGVGSSRTSFSIQQSTQAKGMADACVEAALEVLRTAPAPPPSLSLTSPLGSCTATLSVSGPSRTINSTGTIGTVVRKVIVTTSRTRPKIVIDSWQEAADF